MTEVQSTAEASVPAQAEKAVVLVEKGSEEQAREPHEPIFGPVEDELFGKRIRKSFGSRAFWGTVVDAYVVGRGLFYKVSFDDGDVDILSVDEVKADVQAAQLHIAEYTVANEPEGEDSAAIDGMASPENGASYVDLMRSKKASLKRRRDSSGSESVSDLAVRSLGPWNVKLWSMRLYATIMEEQGYIRLQAFVPMADGEKGELESTGTLQPGDALLAVQGRIVHGVMDHIKACDLIRALPRPLTLTFIRPPSTGESLTKATVASLIKEVTPVQTLDQNGSAAKKVRSNEEAKPPAASEPSPDAGANGPGQRTSRPSTSEVEIVQVTQPAASSVARPQPRRQQASPYFAQAVSQRPSPPAVFPRASSADDVAMRLASNRQAQNPHQVEPIPFRREASPLQRMPSPSLPGAGQMVHLQGNQRVYVQQRVPEYAQGQYHHHNQPAGNYTAAPMATPSAQAPLMSRRPVAYGSTSQPASSIHYAQGHAYQSMGGNGSRHPVSHAQPGGFGHQQLQQQPGGVMIPVRGSAQQHPMTNQTVIAAGPPQSRPTTSYREPRNNNGRAVSYSESSSAYVPSQAPPPPQQPRASLPVAPRSSAPTNTTQPVPERASDKPSTAKQAEPVRTLTDLVEKLSKRRVANAQRQNGGGSATHSPDKQRSSHPAVAASTEEEDFDSFFSNAGLDDDLASTGTSFLSLDDTSATYDTPLPLKPSTLTQSRGVARPSRPNYLSKYATDEVIDVAITKPRLYLTLGAMGDHVAVSSFVRGQFGEIGEIEASGKVLVGDILVGVGSYEIDRGLAPPDVARIVSMQPRPYTAHFMRPSWDMME